MEEKKETAKPKAESEAVAPVPASTPVAEREQLEALEPFGDLIPFADPSWYQGVRPPRSPSEISPVQLAIMLTVSRNSTTLPTSTKRTPLCEQRSANGSPTKSSPLSANGTRRGGSRRKSTRRWEHADTWLV